MFVKLEYGGTFCLFLLIISEGAKNLKLRNTHGNFWRGSIAPWLCLCIKLYILEVILIKYSFFIHITIFFKQPYHTYTHQLKKWIEKWIKCLYIWIVDHVNLYGYCSCGQYMYNLRQTDANFFFVSRPKFCIYVILH